MTSVTEISAIAAVTGVLLGIVYFVIQTRRQTRIMRTDALVRLYSTTNSEEILESFWKVSSIKVKDYEDYVKQYGSPFSGNKRAPIHKSLMKILGTYDLVGNLLCRGLIDLDLVSTVVGIDSAKTLHKSLYPVILGIRRNSGDLAGYAGFDYLINELAKKEPQLKKSTEKMLNRTKAAS